MLGDGWRPFKYQRALSSSTHSACAKAHTCGEGCARGAGMLFPRRGDSEHTVELLSRFEPQQRL
eukprot:12739251-Alexandrium_andersonii.AAC.1